MTNYKVFCADCKARYEQGGKKPLICGVCGSDFIAAKPINVADLCGTMIDAFVDGVEEDGAGVGAYE